MKSIPRTFCLLCAIAALGCGVDTDDDGNNPGPDTDTDTDTDSDTDVDSDTDSDGDADGGDTSSEVCDEQIITIYNDPVEVMILMDHSSSMAGENWNIARNAVYNLMETFAATSLEFGLDTLPDATDFDCGVAAPVIIDCGPDHQTAITEALTGIEPTYSTPLYDAMYNFVDPDYAPGCTAVPNDKYILLLADGEEYCNSALLISDFVSMTSLLVELGVKVIVVGFNVVVDSEQLNAIAANGGTEFTTYLNASDEASLNEALTTIGTSIVSCIFNIDAPDASANPDLVNFYFDEDLVYMDDDCSSGSGWRWANEEHTQVEFCPDSCDLIANGDVGEIKATFGCQTIIE
jgi:hypothetical protein